MAFSLDYKSPRTLSLAGSGRAGALLTDTITLNPSLLGFYQIAAVTGAYYWQNPKQSAAPLFHLSAIDGANPLFGAGFAYTRTSYLDFFHLSAAKKIFETFSVGLHGKRFATRSNSMAAQGSSVVGYDAGVSASYFSKDILPFPFMFSLTSDNLISNSQNQALIGGRQIALGIKFNVYDILVFYGDEVFEKKFSQKLSTTAGALELSLGGGFFIRSGISGGNEKSWGLGGGWVGPRIAINYGFQKSKSPIDEKVSSVSLDIFM